MKKYDLGTRLAGEGGETVLGAKDLGTHAVYLLYGEVKAGGKPRLLKAGVGHEEILLVVSGRMSLKNEEGETLLSAGEAIYLKGEESALAEAAGGDCVYVAAGGHSEGGGHHH